MKRVSRNSPIFRRKVRQLLSSLGVFRAVAPQKDGVADAGADDPSSLSVPAYHACDLSGPIANARDLMIADELARLRRLEGSQ